MTKNLFLDFLREVRKSANRFFSILLIVAIGVAFFAGLRSSAPDMAYTMDEFYDKYNIMDIQVVSTLGLTAEDIEIIGNTEGVKQVQPGYFSDVLCNVSGTEIVIRVNSFPDDYAERQNECINQFILVEGRLPKNDHEVLIEDSDYINFGIAVGDTLTFTSGTDTPLTEGTMKTDEFKVVGMVQTPYYLSFDKGTSQIGGMSIEMYAYVKQEAFDYGDIFVDALVTVEGAKELNAFDKQYANLIEAVATRLKNLGVNRSLARGEELRVDAEAQLADAQKTYDEQSAEFEKQIAEAQKELDDGYTELVKSEKDLEKGKETLEIEVKNAQEQIATGEQTLRESAVQLANSREMLNTAKEGLANAQTEYDNTMANTAQAREMLASAESALATITTGMESIQERIDAADDETREELSGLLDMYTSLYETTNQTYLEAKELNDSVNSAAVDTQKLLNDANAAVKDAEVQLNDAQREYSDGWEALAQGRAELASKKAEAEKEFADAEKKIADGWEEYNKGKEEFEQQKAEGEELLAEGNAQLIAAKYEIEKIGNAQWYMLDRTTNYGFASYKSTVDRMKALASIIPVFFILVAVLVCMTTMTRMVNDQRGVIGTYKALGYDDNAIAAKYIYYVLAASLVGAVAGAVVGVKLFPQAVYNAWSAMYIQPKLSQQIHWIEIAISFVVTIVAMVITAYYTCRVELKSVPAQLMRPKSPKLGKTILLERIGFLWNKMSFSKKVTMRNIFRYKKRLLMTVIGIMGCTALLMAGFGMNDTISSVIDNQFVKVFQIDMLVTADNISDNENIAPVIEEKGGKYINVGAGSVTLDNDNNSETATIYVTDDPQTFQSYILLQNRVTEKPLSLDNNGVVLTEKLAERLNVKVGDNVDITDSDNITKSIPVVGIAENYVFHYAYMQESTYNEYFMQGLEKTTFLVKLGGNKQTASELRDSLQKVDGVSSVTLYTEVAEDFYEQIAALKSIIIIIIVCAALLAFVVLYNLTNINISERIREIATIKVLGFKRSEVAMYIYRENFILTLIGAFFGLFCGIGLHRVIIKAIEQNYVMFGYSISPLSYAYSVVLTCVFSIVVMIYMYRTLVNIPMVESLKSVE